MENTPLLDNVQMLLSKLIQWNQDILFNPTGFVQLGAIVITYLFAWRFVEKIRRYLERDVEKVRAHLRFVLSPAHFTIILKYTIWLLLVWFCQVLFKNLSMRTDLLHASLNLIGVLLIIRFATFYIKSTFWARVVYVACLLVVSLRFAGLWVPTIRLLDSMKIDLGSIRLSVWGVIEASAVFIFLWIIAAVLNRFIGQWLSTATKLTASDRILLQRVIRTTLTALVILISLRAAGIHTMAIAVTGGAIGFAIGIGLQKIGSNLISGIMLLINKPIRPGDVIAFEESFAGANWGWVDQMDLLYVQVSTPGGTLLIIPNEYFVTQKTENLSYSDNLIRLNIPVGVSYSSNLDNALTSAVTAAMSIERVLKIPEPKCFVKEFGDSTVNLELRIWINDPKNGIASVKNAVLLKVWDSFHTNGIEIAFPQRDLHIKEAVPLKIYREVSHESE
jgi:small-conductance mechanosensitive channel